MKTWWHILKSTARFGAAEVQRTWDDERAARVVTAGYGNAADGPGRDKLGKYQPGDRIVVYAPRHGAIAVAEVGSEAPHHIHQPTMHDHAHRLGVTWVATIADLADAVPACQVKRCGVYLPRTLATRIAEPEASALCLCVSRAADRPA